MIEYPIIGMSPGNSYFKDEVVKELVKKVIEKYGMAAVFVADVPAISTYIALGYPKNRARKDKAIPQGNNLKNKTRKAMAELGYSDAQVRIVDWASEIAENPAYKNEYATIRALYQHNSAFKEAVHVATKAVLEGEGQIENIDEAVEIAAEYLLSEFAFLEFAPKYFGVDKVTYVYHKVWPVYESYRTGMFDGKNREYLGADIILVNAN